MSNKQLESFVSLAKTDKKIQKQVDDCGSNNVCVAQVGLRYGLKFSAANVGRWQRDHEGVIL